MPHSFEIRNIDKRLDGVYPVIQQREFTALEWSWIKTYSGYMPTTIDDGLDGLDAPLIIILSIISLHRSGKVGKTGVQSAWEILSDAPYDPVGEFPDEEKPTVRLVVDPDVTPPAEESGANPTTGQTPPS